MRWFITGPTYGDLSRLKEYNGSNIIILGDSEFFSGNNPKILKEASAFKSAFYCIRGSHDNHPDNVPGVIAVYDDEVKGVVYYNPEYPNVRFFEDGQIYTINNKRILTIGGGKLLNEREFILSGKRYYTNTGLSKFKMKDIENNIKGEKVDEVLTYTAPKSWINPKTEDSSIERWMTDLCIKFDWKKWYFSRYEEDINLSKNITELHKHIVEL